MSRSDGYEWKSISGRRVRREHPLGFSIVKPEDDACVPYECPVCDQLMRLSADPHAYSLWGCCSTCSTLWAEARRAEWSAGWRPTKQEVADRFDALGMTKRAVGAT